MNELIQLLNQVISFYRLPETDTFNSQYESPQEAIEDMQTIIDSLKNGDITVLSKLSLLFAPTGSIQEISLDSGWDDEYIEVSTQIDRIIERLMK